MAHSRQILNGPSKFDLMVSLLVGDKTRQVVFFNLHKEGGGRGVIINSLARACPDSDDVWEFRGWWVRVIPGETEVHGSFSTQTRKGEIVWDHFGST